MQLYLIIYIMLEWLWVRIAFDSLHYTFFTLHSTVEPCIMDNSQKWKPRFAATKGPVPSSFFYYSCLSNIISLKLLSPIVFRRGEVPLESELNFWGIKSQINMPEKMYIYVHIFLFSELKGSLELSYWLWHSSSLYWASLYVYMFVRQLLLNPLLKTSQE